MSRHRVLLRTLVSLGVEPDKIAADVPMLLSAVMDTLRDDWPVQPRFKIDLETYGHRILLQAHRAGGPELQEVIERVFRRVFGMSLCDSPPIDCETQRAIYVMSMLKIDFQEVFPLWIGSEPEDNEHLVSWVRQRLEVLCDEYKAMDATDATVAAFLRTLEHVVAVMAGVEDPADNDWFNDKHWLKRGCPIDHKLVRRKERDA